MPSTAYGSTVYCLPPTAYRLPRPSLERVPINGREGSTNVGYSLEGQMLGSLTPSIHVTGFHQTGSPFRDVQQNLAGNTETIVQTSPGENQLFRTFTLPSSFLPPSSLLYSLLPLAADTGQPRVPVLFRLCQVWTHRFPLSPCQKRRSRAVWTLAAPSGPLSAFPCAFSALFFSPPPQSANLQSALYIE